MKCNRKMRRGYLAHVIRRKCVAPLFAVALLGTVVTSAVSFAAAPESRIALTRDDKGRAVFELHGAKLGTTPVDRLQRQFVAYAVFDTPISDQPPLVGNYAIIDGGLRFTPRFPLQPGMKYRAVYRAASGSEEPLVEEFLVPQRKQTTAPRVAAIYPSAATLPENQLKFYIHFTAPMSRGGAYEHLQLLDADGKPVDLPFLELAEELWNPAGDRLTLLLDPGRVKQELKPREEVGPVLAAGRRFTLVVDRLWRDAAGQPLAAELRKSFAVAVADEACPNPKTWRLSLPSALSRTPLVVRFGEPLDHALLERMLWVVDEQDEQVPGEIDIGQGESSWSFRPEEPWHPGRYRLVSDTLLEDLAGNSIARKFELDARKNAKSATEEETVSMEFQIKE